MFFNETPIGNDKDSHLHCFVSLPIEATSWSVSESDLTGQGIDEDEDDVNLAPDGGSLDYRRNNAVKYAVLNIPISF